jgi:hypothetical protein
MDGICRFWTLILIKRQKCPQLVKKIKNFKGGLTTLGFSKGGWASRGGRQPPQRWPDPPLGVAHRPPPFLAAPPFPLYFFIFFKFRVFMSFFKLS